MTGSDLLHQKQEHFVYASVAMSFERAEEHVHRLIRNHRLQGDELKGRQLVRTTRGRRAISALLPEITQEVQVVIHLKKYALACKFFEYIFEPVLSERNSIFYSIGFNVYIANLIYMWTVTNDKEAENLLEEFADFMRSMDPLKIPSIFGKQHVVQAIGTNPLHDIGAFCIMHKNIIAQEINLMGSVASNKWILDLTLSSLFSLLCHWGDIYHQLDVYCDDSKPLHDDLKIFEHMINRLDRSYQSIRNRKRLLTFNLSRVPQLVRSEDSFGVQIADVIASAVRHAHEHTEDIEAAKWIEILAPCISADSVWPDIDTLDPETPEGLANGMVLRELVERSVRQEDLFDGIEDLVSCVKANFSSLRRRRNDPRVK